jgi:hypothetical protein
MEYIESRDEWGCVKRKIIWGKVKHCCYFSEKQALKFVSTKNKVRISFCPVFHTAPFSHIDFTPKKFNFFLLKSCFLPIKSHKT